MKIVAFTYVYNEEDIIQESIEHMLAQGCDVYVVDNWSTDNTREIVIDLTYKYQGQVQVERFPGKPTEYFELDTILKRIEVINYRIDPDWGLLFGADELFESPWHDTVLAQFLTVVGGLGYTAMPATEVVFHPVDDGWCPGMSMKEYFRYWSLGRTAKNVRAWRGRMVKFLDGGHDVDLGNRKKLWLGKRLIIRHYPYRNQQQAERKVFQERKPRFAPAELAIGWHTHMSGMEPGYNFIKDKNAGLHEYNPETFYDEVQQWQTS